MLTDLVQIKRHGEQKREENARLRRHMKQHPVAERRLRRISEAIEEQVDCTACANCCKLATVKLNERDVERLAKHFRLTPGRFLPEYAVRNEEEGWVLKQNAQGCVFLSGTFCTIYEIRPHSCELFPHLTKGPGSLMSRMWEMPDRACYCPIVYNAMEAFKEESGFKR
jgi:hypothetical protein